MMLKRQLMRVAKEQKVPLPVIEKDYALGWFLEGLGKNSFLKNRLLLKGGTALRKCCFENYRFSEDLDFTDVDLSLSKEEASVAIAEISSWMLSSLRDVSTGFEVDYDLFESKFPHPRDMRTFTISVKFPWHSVRPLCKIMIEITTQEKLLYPPNAVLVLDTYRCGFSSMVKIYAIEEVVAEKLRAILTATKKVHEEDMTRTRTRDYFDLWFLLCKSGLKIKGSNFCQKLREKCQYVGCAFQEVDDFFDPRYIELVEDRWDTWIMPLSSEKVGFSKVEEDLRQELNTLIFEQEGE